MRNDNMSVKKNLELNMKIFNNERYKKAYYNSATFSAAIRAMYSGIDEIQVIYELSETVESLHKELINLRQEKIPTINFGGIYVG